MRGLFIGLLLIAPVAACAPYEAPPASGYQWQQRQDRIERQWRDEQAKKAPAQTSTPTAAPPAEETA